VEVGTALVADGQAAEACQPSKGAFHDPAVASKALAVVDPTPGDPGLDAALTAFSPAAAMVVALVGVQLGGPSPRATALARANRRHRVQDGGEQLAVVAVGAAQGVLIGME
jgi:hypothetical protein